jgi:hypothetical protein
MNRFYEVETSWERTSPEGRPTPGMIHSTPDSKLDRDLQVGISEKKTFFSSVSSRITIGGSITVPLTSCLTGLELAVS